MNFDPLTSGGGDDTSPNGDARTGDGAMGMIDGRVTGGGVTVMGSSSAFGSGTINTPGTVTLEPGDTIIIATARGMSDTTAARFAGMNLPEDAPIPAFGTGPVFASIWSYRATGQVIGNASSVGNGGTPAVMVALVVRGLAANPLDRTALSSGTGTSAMVGPTAMTSTGTELVISLFASDASTCMGTWAPAFTEQGPVGSTNICASVGAKIVTASGTQSATYGTFSSRNWGTAIATYRGP